MSYNHKEYQKDYRSQPEHIARQKQYKLKMRERKHKLLNEHLGDCCSQCGSKDRLELDHINPSIKGHHSATGHRGLNTSLSHIMSQLDENNLQWLCHYCHKERTRLQNGASWNLFINLPLDKQQELMLQYQQDHPQKY